MATTGPYIIYKSSQFCAAVRSNVNFEPPLRIPIRGVMFSFPNGANTLPPRLNLKSLTTAVNVFCQQVREKREMFLMGRQNMKQSRRRLRGKLHSHTRETRGDKANCSENSIVGASASNVRLLSAAGFLWNKENITDQELKRCKRDLCSNKTRKGEEEKSDSKDVWEEFTRQEQLKVWRRPLDTSGLYEYKVFGTFFDINARSFYRTQIDNEYRKVWDQFVLKLDVVDRDPHSGSEVLHWVMKYPYPLRSRDYVFVRRGQVDHQSMTMVLMSRATSHPLCPETDEHVRVSSYQSNMVILPHRTFEENGFDFVLSYFDNPKTNFPSLCMNVLTSSNLPTFIATLHNAAAGLNQPQDKTLQAM